MLHVTYVSGTTVSLSRFLQKSSIDIKKATDALLDTMTILEEKRQSAEPVFDQLFSEAREISAKLGVELKTPRTVSRQTHRGYMPVQSVVEYYRRTVYIPLLENIISDLKERLSSDVMNLFNLGVFLPRTTYTNEDLESVCEAAEFYKLLTDAPVASVIAEYQLWIAKWKREFESGAELPNDLPKIIDLCDIDLYPSIKIFLSILATLPISVATAERTFSTLRRLKTWLRATMGEERLTGLALMHIHRDIEIDIDAVITRFAKNSKRRLD